MSMENHRVTIPNAHLPKIAKCLRHKVPRISAVHHFSVSSLWTDRAHISAVPSVSAFWLDSSSAILHQRFLLVDSAAAAAAKSRQLCPSLSDPMDCSPPGSSVHGIFQARVLEWGAIAFSVVDSSQV